MREETIYLVPKELKEDPLFSDILELFLLTKLELS